MRLGGRCFYKEARKAGDFEYTKAKKLLPPIPACSARHFHFMVSRVHYKADFFIRRPGKQEIL
jgi:hypothetical protein